MWRKQDEPKPPGTPPDTTAPQQAVPSPKTITPVPAAPVQAVPAAPTPLAPAPLAPAQAPPTPPAPAPGSHAIPQRFFATSPGHIAKGLVIKGEITGREDLLIEGEVHGQIRMPESRVTIGTGGRVVACVEAREIVVRGRVKGDLRAGEHVHIGNTGSLIGDAVTPRIAIDEGAELRGNLDTTRTADRQVARAATAAGAVPSNPGKGVQTRA